jgi:protein-S-isoprenylcysteine O-methyltransferase Ste14
MFILIRVVVYATAFVGLLLVFVPAQLLTWADIPRPVNIRAPQITGLVLAALGGILVLWTIVALATAGRGRLVVTGPYRYMRHPMYFGAALAIAGAALFYQSPLLLAYASVFLLFSHFFVVFYEEPALQRAFGEEYDSYRQQVGRWGPPASIRRRSGARPKAVGRRP